MRTSTHILTRTTLFFTLLLAAPAASFADDPPKPGQASETPSPSKAQMMAGKQFFDRGQQLYAEGKYEAAWIEFSSAYEIAPLPDLVFNMARCEVKMNRLKEAIGHYREFLRMRPDDPESERIRDEVNRLEKQLNGTADPQPVPPPPPPPPPPPRRFPIAGTLLGGGTVLFLVFGGAAVGVATSRFNDLNGSCAPTCSDEQVQTVRTPLNAGYAMFGLAAVAAVATAVVLPFELGVFGKDKEKDQKKVALRISLSSIEVAGRF
jgi:tetratricopeptide (TPR) repeat protein